MAVALRAAAEAVIPVSEGRMEKVSISAPAARRLSTSLRMKVWESAG